MAIENLDITVGDIVAGQKIYASNELLRYAQIENWANEQVVPIASLGDYFNVKLYGATGDGVIDDTDAINLAIAAATGVGAGGGGTVFFPAGTYVTTGITIADHGMSIVGAGQYATFIKLKDGTNGAGHVINSNQKAGISLRDFRVYANHENNPTHSGFGIYLDNSFYGRFENVDVRHYVGPFANDPANGSPMGPAWQLTNSNNNTFNSCQAHFCEDAGWWLDATSQHNTFNSCGAEDCQDYGINCLGIGNVFNAPWVERVTSGDGASLIGIQVNGRDNIINAPEIRGSAGTPLTDGIRLGSSSLRTTLTNPNSANATNPIIITGASQDRALLQISPAETITNTNNDTTTYIKEGNLRSSAVASSPVTFVDSDATPSVLDSNVFFTNTSGVTITRFDNGIAGQEISIISKGAIVFDTSSASRLIGSSVDITTATGDVTIWVCEIGGTTSSVWRLKGFVDISVDNSAGA